MEGRSHKEVDRLKTYELVDMAFRGFHLGEYQSI